MVLRHSFYYLLARGLPGVLSFAALILYTRLLSAEEYGKYALVIAGIGLVQVLVFQWLQLVLARFVPIHRENPAVVLKAVLALFATLAATIFVIGSAAAFFWPDPYWQKLLFLATILCIAQSWIEINLQLASIQIKPVIYGRILAGKNSISLIIGGILAVIGFATFAPLLGLLAGTLGAWFIFGASSWKGIRPRWPAPADLNNYTTYGLPLAITFALGWIVSSSDRVILSWLIDDAATGVYAAGYDLAQQSLGLLMIIVNTAAYPLVMRALEKQGKPAASEQLGRSGELVIVVAFGGAAGMIALTPHIVNVVIGLEFRSEAQEIIPWIAASAAISGVKAFHLDIAFQLALKSKWQAYTTATTAAINIALNFLLIPIIGIVGAAVATLLSFSIASILSWWLGRRIFPMPALAPLISRGILVALATYLGAIAATLFNLTSFETLICGLVIGGMTAAGACWTLNVAGIRSNLKKSNF